MIQEGYAIVVEALELGGNHPERGDTFCVHILPIRGHEALTFLLNNVVGAILVHEEGRHDDSDTYVVTNAPLREVLMRQYGVHLLHGPVVWGLIFPPEEQEAEMNTEEALQAAEEGDLDISNVG